MSIVRNKKIIRFTHILLSIVLVISILGFVLIVVAFALSLINPSFHSYASFLDVPISIKQSGDVVLQGGEVYSVFLRDARISFSIIDAYSGLKTINFIFNVCVYLVASFIFFILWKIFSSLKNSVKTNNPFNYTNIKRIKLIAYALFLFSFFNISYILFLKYYWIEKIIINNLKMDVVFNWESVETLFLGIIILVIAEVYRIGTEIKKEQELTI
ncbi:MAG: DUF2975 domain-containing protein [Bacteroidales bacterium]|jgi:hypothetical protein|nr:DUF2975 domain-containing protein [Bacteroidales bacterium]